MTGRPTAGWAAGVALVAAMAAGGAAAAAEIGGVWKSEPGEGGKFIHVEIAPCEEAEGRLCGTIIGAFEGADEAIVGRPIIWDMEPDGEGRWSGGRIWAPDEDETYRSKMALEDDRLEVSGCILGGFICRGQDWTRVE